MAKTKEPVNPFYVLLVIVGASFAITASAYGMMAYRAVTPGPASTISSSGHQMMAFLDQYGMQIMLVELVLLAVFSFAAMGIDRYWSLKQENSRKKRAEG